MAKNKERLDVLLVQRGLAETRARAQAIIMSGDGLCRRGRGPIRRALLWRRRRRSPVHGSQCPYVSRGGLKLAKALREFWH